MKKIFLSLFSTLLVVCAIIIGGYWQAAYVAKPDPSATPMEFVVQSGETVKSIAAQLQSSGIINNAFAFEVFAKLNGAASQLQAGSFQLKPGMSFQDVVTALGNAVGQDVQVTIPEGQTDAQIGVSVHAVIPTITEGEWNSATTGTQAVGPDVPASVREAVDAHGYEGFLFPDTYRLDPHATADKVVGTLWANFWTKVPAAGIKEDANGKVAQGLTLYQVVTLASIVQMEAKNPADMNNVADVFLKRLDMNMPLQSDATVSYAVGHAALSTLDLASPSPYNTYAHTGLPPGPIDNPGLDAIQAVVHPTSNPYYYFLTKPDGNAVFAKNYDEQVANKQKYLK